MAKQLFFKIFQLMNPKLLLQLEYCASHAQRLEPDHWGEQASET